jgi:hypothetical protein
MEHYLWLVPLGFVVGAYGTLIGAGGGFVLMPVLLVLFPAEGPELLAAVSLAVVFFNAASGSVAYARMRRIDYRSALVLAAATIPGAVLGAMTTGYVPRRMFDAVLGTLMVLACAFLLWRPTPAKGEGSWSPRLLRILSPPLPEGEPASDTDRLGTYNLGLGLGLSFGVGYLSSLLGIGGGIIHVPVLSRLLRFPVHVATATSHLILAIMALAGTAVHVASGTFVRGTHRTAALAVGVVLGAQLGAWLSGRIRGGWIIRGLAGALGIVGIRVLLLAL